MKKLIVTRGIPGSGKTTWAKQQAGCLRVSRDDIRRMIHGRPYLQEYEPLVRRIRNQALFSILEHNDVVVIADETCCKKQSVRELKYLAQIMGADFEIKDFETPLEECIARDAKRLQPVGEEVIRDLWEKLQESKK